MITVLCCRGIGEGSRENMLANVTKHLDPARFRGREVPWRASYGPVPDPSGWAFDAALSDGEELLLDMIADDPYPVVLLGYSGGAALAGNVARKINQRRLSSLDVRAVGLISDPLRPPSGPLKWGIAGHRWVGGPHPVWHLADPADVITSCPAESPLRTLADQSAAFSLVDPAAWGWDMIQRLRQQRWQATIRDWRNTAAVWRAYSDAIDGAQGYLFRGDHTGYSTRLYPGSTRTYTEWLADRINEIRE